MMKRGHWLLGVWLACGPALVFGQGGPPLVTDDPGTVEKGHWEINVAWTREHRPGETNQELPLVDLNYGLSEHLQLKYEGAWLRETAAGAGTQTGASDSLVGLKWRFLDEARRGIAVSTYPQLGVRTVTSSVHRGISSGGTTVILPLQLQKNFGAVSFNADVGYGGDTRSADAWFGGLAVGYETGKLELLAEIHAEREVGARGEQVLCNAGFRRQLSEHVTLLFSLGREIRNRTAQRATVSYLGLQLTR